MVLQRLATTNGLWPKKAQAFHRASIVLHCSAPRLFGKSQWKIWLRHSSTTWLWKASLYTLIWPNMSTYVKLRGSWRNAVWSLKASLGSVVVRRSSPRPSEMQSLLRHRAVETILPRNLGAHFTRKIQQNNCQPPKIVCMFSGLHHFLFLLEPFPSFALKKTGGDAFSRPLFRRHMFPNARVLLLHLEYKLSLWSFHRWSSALRFAPASLPRTCAEGWAM